MPSAPNYSSAHGAANSKRQLKSAAVTSVAASDVFTTTAAFLNDLQVGDEVSFNTLTGGAGIVPGQTYYILSIPSSTTFTVAATPKGALFDHTSNITAGNVSAGLLTAAADGPLAGNFVAMGSLAGGGPVQGD